MKILKLVANEWRLLKANPVISIFLTVVFPLFLAGLMAFSQSSFFSSTDEQEPIWSISFVDEADSDLSQAFSESFTSDAMQAYFTIEDPADYIITIPENFDQMLSEEVTLSISSDRSYSSIRSLQGVLQYFLENLQAGQAEAKLLAASGADLSDLLELQDFRLLLHEEDLFQTKTHQGKEALTSAQYYAVWGLFYIAFMGMSMTSQKATEEKLIVLDKRVLVTPVTVFERTIADFLFTLTYLLGSALIYILISRFLFDDALSGSLLKILLVFAIQGMVFTSLGLLLGSSRNKLVTLILSLVVTVLFFFLGGMLPFDRIFPDNQLLGSISQTISRTISLGPIQQAKANAPWSEFIPLLLISTALSIVFLGLVIVIEKKRQEA